MSMLLGRLSRVWLVLLAASLSLLAPLGLTAQRSQKYDRVVTTGPGQPQWIEQGPAAIDPMQSYNQAGAIEAILVDPSNPARIFIGSVNGGIWQTANGTSSDPLWRSTTDSLRSLSIFDLSFDPTDQSRNTVYAGIGDSSNDNGVNGYISGPFIGVVRSTDGGSSWAPVGGSTLNNLQVRKILPTSTTTPGHVVLAATSGGLFRSTDNASSFQQLATAQGVPAGGVTDMVADPVSSTTFYAAILGAGIFRSTDAGASWKNITYNIPSAGDTGYGSATRIRLAISAAPTNPLYVAIGTSVLTAVYRTTNKASGPWTSIGSPGNSASPQTLFGTFGFAADPKAPDIVYACGYGNTFLLYIAQIGASGTAMWSPLYGNISGRNIGAPHPDSRQIVFDSTGDLLLSSDGGLYRLHAAGNASQQTWIAINGNLAITEINSVAYDTLNAIVFSGHQDTGSAQQTSEEGTVWQDTTGGDGTEQGADNSGANSTVRFTTIGGNLSQDFYYRTYDDHNKPVGSPTHPLFASPSTPTQAFTGFLPTHAKDCGPGNPGPGSSYDCMIGFGGFVLNKVAPSRIIFFGGALYEGALKADGTGDYGNTINVVSFPSTITAVHDNTHQAAAYGGWSKGVANPGVIYVGFNVTESGSTANVDRLFMRQSDGGSLVELPFPETSVQGVAMSPSDWNVVYAISATKVYRSVKAGQSWTDITGSLSLTTLRTIDVIPTSASSGDDRIVVGGDFGIFASDHQGAGTWTRVGSNMPPVEVNDLHYYPAAARGGRAVGDLLVAGTIGRGNWTWPFNAWRMNLSTGSAFNVHSWKGAWGSDGPIVVGDFNGDGKTDVMMWRDSTKSWTVNLSTGSGFSDFEWKGAWGSDGPVIVGDFNGDGKTDVMMWRDSTKSWTVNLSTGSGFSDFEWKGAWGSDGPVIVGDFNGDGKTDVMMWRDSTKSWTVNLSTGSGFSDFEWKGAWGSDGPIIVGDFNGDGKTDVMMWRDSTKSWTVNLSTGSGFSDFEWKGAWGSDGPVIVGDFNGDGKTDVMMWRDSTKSWTVNLSTGSGFSDFEWKGAWGSDGPIIVGDFNGDGKTDVMMWRDSTKSWTVNLSTGSGFSDFEWKGAWGSDGPIIVGDFNGDHKTDIVVWRKGS